MTLLRRQYPRGKLLLPQSFVRRACAIALPFSSWWPPKKVRCEAAPTFYIKISVFSHSWATTCCSTPLWISYLCSVSDLVWISTQKPSKWLPLRNRWVTPRAAICQNGATHWLLVPLEWLCSTDPQYMPNLANHWQICLIAFHCCNLNPKSFLISLNGQCHQEHARDPLKMWTKYCKEIYVSPRITLKEIG